MGSDSDAYAAGARDLLGLVGQLAATAPAALLLASGDKPVTMRQLASAIALLDPAVLHMLRPFDPAEALAPKQAAGMAGVSEGAVRGWCDRYRIGRKVVGSLRISRVALAALLDDNPRALAAYLGGDRSSPAVLPYISRRVDIS